MSLLLLKYPARVVASVITAVVMCSVLGYVYGEEKLDDPIYRVASDTPAVQPTASAQLPAAAPTAAPAAPAPTAPVPAAPAATAAKSPFDLTQKAGEHPLAPVLRAVKESQEEIDRSIRDYKCTLVKQERVDGELGEKQHIFMKVMQQPFSVYMSFLQPFAGREVLYVSGQNSGNMIVLDAGFKRMLGKMNLDPNGTLAMNGQKHPITDVGIRNLTAKLIKMWDAETKFAECEITTNPEAKISDRSSSRMTTMIQVVHPIPRQDFKFHVARLFLDNELKIPIHFDAYLWPEQEGADPPLDESYTYTDLKLNNGFTAREFDAKENTEIFK